MFIILDRDGVINEESVNYIKNPDEWIPIPGSLDAIARLKFFGHSVVVATNQSGIARGLYTHEGLHRIHQKMHGELANLGTSLDGIFYCPHHPRDECLCRKPQPGLLLKIANEFKIDLAQAICIGDSLRDIQAAQKVQARAMLVLTGNGKEAAKMLDPQVPVYLNLAKAVDAILELRS